MNNVLFWRCLGRKGSCKVYQKFSLHLASIYTKESTYRANITCRPSHGAPRATHWVKELFFATGYINSIISDGGYISGADDVHIPHAVLAQVEKLACPDHRFVEGWNIGVNCSASVRGSVNERRFVDRQKRYRHQTKTAIVLMVQRKLVRYLLS